MKTSDFLTETHHIVDSAAAMHADHEVQMAREECYHAASNAIELHRMLKHLSEEQGLEAWASEKITLANDYLRTVKEWLEYELMSNIQDPAALVGHLGEDAGSTTSTSSIATSMTGPSGAAGSLFGGKKEKKMIKRRMK